jgi:hypothetical protein
MLGSGVFQSAAVGPRFTSFREVVIAWCDGRSAIWSSEWQRRLIIAPSVRADRRHKLGRWGQTASGGRSAIFIMSSEVTRPTAWSVSSCSRRGRSNRRRKSNQKLAAACCGVGGKFWHEPAVRGNAAGCLRWSPNRTVGGCGQRCQAWPLPEGRLERVRCLFWPLGMSMKRRQSSPFSAARRRGRSRRARSRRPCR